MKKVILLNIPSKKKEKNCSREFCFFILLLLKSSFIFGQQTYVNKVWEGTVGTMGSVNKTSSILDSENNLIVASNSNNGSFGTSDIVVTKYSSEGIMLWQQFFNGSANGNDYAVQVEVNEFDEILVGAAIDEGFGLDFGVIKYSSIGQLIFSVTWDSGNNLVDLPSDIGIDISGSIYIIGGSQSISGEMDYAIVKFNSDGNYQWHTFYDYVSLQDFATGMVIKENSLSVTGNSASALNNWDFATLELDLDYGTILNVNRVEIGGIGFDKAAAIVLDSQDNIFITGYVEISGNRDIQTIKLNANFELDWIKSYDGGFEDIASAIAVDASGSIYVVGAKENSAGGKDFLTIKYDQLGNELWVREFGSEGNDYIAFAENLAIRDNGDLFATGSLDKINTKEIATICYSPSGALKMVELFNSGSQIIESKVILVSNNEFFVNGIIENEGDFLATSIKYSVIEKPNLLAVDGNDVQYNSGEIVISFDRSSMINSAIDNKNFTSGKLSDFVNQSAINELNSKTGFDWAKFDSYKIFRRMTTSDTISITRLGDTIRINDFWTTISVFVPFNVNEQQLCDSLNTLNPWVEFAERNYIYELFSMPNDPYYQSEQSGLFDPNYGINIEEAWTNQVGGENIKIGSFDTGINWRHEDYGDGTSAGSKVKGGWNYELNVSPFSEETPDQNGHGTATSGIFGALRNNSKGVAGIAGGDIQLDNQGCQIYSFKITYNSIGGVNLTNAVEAIVEGAVYNPYTNFGYGLHIQNHSWGGVAGGYNLKQALLTCYKIGCVFVASSGNDGNGIVKFPASFNDELVLKVGASDTTGGRAGFSNYGTNLDVIAPGVNNTYASLDNFNNSGYSYNGNGTSFAAPMVTGICALLCSEHTVENGYPNSLAPEDVEEIITRFSTDVSTLGYDSLSGFGRANAFGALTKLRLPEYQIKHAGGQNITQIESMSNIQVNILSLQNDVPAGAYYATRYEVTQTFFDELSQTQNVINHWPRYSSSIGVSSSNIISGNTHFDYSTLIGQESIYVTSKTYCWHIMYNSQGELIDKWIPAMPNRLRTTYSLHLQDSFASVIDEISSNSELDIFPNPTKNSIILKYTSADVGSVKVIVFDNTGKIILNSDLGNMQKGVNTSQIDIDYLPEGLYLVNLIIDNDVISKRFCKLND